MKRSIMSICATGLPSARSRSSDSYHRYRLRRRPYGEDLPDDVVIVLGEYRSVDVPGSGIPTWAGSPDNVLHILSP